MWSFLYESSHILTVSGIHFISAEHTDCGTMVEHLTPDPKVVCSTHVSVKWFFMNFNQRQQHNVYDHLKRAYVSCCIHCMFGRSKQGQHFFLLFTILRPEKFLNNWTGESQQEKCCQCTSSQWCLVSHKINRCFLRLCSTSDSRSAGCVFKSRQGQFLFTFLCGE